MGIMNLGQVIGALGTLVQGATDADPIVAVTPHGSYTFDIVGVDQEVGQPITLRLREKEI